MFIKIPFESTLDFKTNIYEITKMSLEHDYNVNEGAVLGNFYVTGEYRSHEVSVNKEPFKFTLPFEVEISDDIDLNTLEFNIEDFSYTIEGENKLKVNIEYSLAGEERKGELIDTDEDVFEEVPDEELQREMDELDELINKEEVTEEVKEDEKPKEVTEQLEEIKEEVGESPETEEPTEDDERLTKEQEKTIMETITSSDDTFVTYHVHMVKESETMESIATMYSIPTSLLQEYNNVDTITLGDKILIPKVDE